MHSAKQASQRLPTPMGFKTDEMTGVHFSSKAIVVETQNEDDLEGVLHTEDIPSVHQLQLTMDNGGTVKRTIICDSMVAYEMQTLPSKTDGRQIYQICGRTIEGKGIFPFAQFTSCVRVAATHMAQNISVYGGNEVTRFSQMGFWSPRIKLLYGRAMAAYAEASRGAQADPSMVVDEVFVTAQVTVRPYSLRLTLCAFPFSQMGTCQVRVCKGSRPSSFVKDFQLSNDPLGLTRLITPPISDVVLLDPATKRLSQGLLSNFFATRYIGPPAGRRQTDTDSPPPRTQLKNYLLVSAPLETIERGPLVDEVWAISRRDGIQVSFAGPDLREALADRWSGAFILSSAYQVLPIDTMHVTDRKSSKVELGVCPLVAHLQEEIMKQHHHTAPQFL
ncbi:hypothetical protein COEREDRAFT_7139 [Coemansia reversa NRRL 1564]|uniref:Uncharacterized protein n=1 Tax=Coemansia reversa (strain ATCC 12441 / NRRL 1564) TaxID=763665 RepID=A0A2G5BG61_COERN|nr:hypothetical protein COEREDRAFT_7139 [Coemansia reversa NRRL 1564]|eukprot:PIA17962.1 hypothetical protein COEREDRAFT_7139 [Coemansia reversa NRRL 1564]